MSNYEIILTGIHDNQLCLYLHIIATTAPRYGCYTLLRSTDNDYDGDDENDDDDNNDDDDDDDD